MAAAETTQMDPSDLTWDRAHWAEMEALFHRLSDTTPESRDAVLRDSKADPEVKRRVLEMIAAQTETAPSPASTQRSGQIGPWHLERLLGTGGLGAVYLARAVRGGAMQQCALKVLGWNATGAAMQARFLREQQIVATLEHAHITRMMDAGFSEQSQPYLAMEYVDGVSLTEFCDAQRMTLRDRITLFLQVCDAVSYAHRRLVVHLDLKPGNILVSKDGVTKLLDFGISKLIESDTVRTTTVLATPAYASPEQLSGQAISTACDIYGLGAVLYELLGGAKTWGDASTLMIMENALREKEPLPLSVAGTDEAARRRGLADVSALQSELRGDLSSIVGRCLRNRPNERYATVDALREDLHRYLAGRPVLARPQTVRYRALKFLRRNRLSVSIASFAVIVVMASLIVATVRQRAASLAAERAQRMQNFLYSVLRLANTNYSGHPLTTIEDFLHLSVQALPEYIHDPADQRSARLSLAESMFDNSDYEHALPVLLSVRDQAVAANDVAEQAEASAFAGMTESELGHATQAKALLDAAMTLRYRRGVTPAQRLWIVGFYVSDRYNQGVRSIEDANLLESTIAEVRRAQVPNRELAWAIGNLATIHSRLFRIDDAERETAETLKILKREPYTTCDQAEALNTLGDLDALRGHDALSLVDHQQAYQSMAACKGPNDLNTLELQTSLARLMIKLNRGDDVARLLEPSVAVWQSTLPGNPQIGYVYTILAQARLQQSRYPEAVKYAEQAIVAEEGKFPVNGLAIGLTEAVLAQGLSSEGNKEAALSPAKRAEHIFSAQSVLSPASKRVADQNAALLANLRQP